MESDFAKNDKCPICHEQLTLGEPVNDSCELCGMAIRDRQNAPCYSNTQKGDVRFCCGRCRMIYVSEAKKNRHLLDFLKLLNSKGTCKEDEFMREAIIDCINRKYPMEVERFGR